MQEAHVPKLYDQQIVPYFQLPSNRETMVSTADYKQRSNLVIVFFHSIECPECRQYLCQLADNYSSFQQVATEILAISLVSVEGAKRLVQELGLPFPVLADDTAKVSEKFTYLDAATRTPVPAVFVLDRFGALFSQTVSSTEAGLPQPDDILGWLNLIEIQCPECGVSEWTMPGS